MERNSIYTISGRKVSDLAMKEVLAGDLTAEDFRISPERLQHQAVLAESAGYRQLGRNLRRAAELTCISNEEVFNIYDALRPGRSTYRQLIALADRLDRGFKAPLTADLVREAAEVYSKRGILRQDKQENREETGTNDT